MSSSKQQRIDREKSLKKIREKFGLREQKSYSDYLKEEKENAEKGRNNKFKKIK